jgi:flagellar biosynthesis protein FliR
MDILHPALAQVHIFLLVFFRVTAMVALMPILGSQTIQIQLKLGISVALSIILVPFIPAVAMPAGFWEYAVLLIKEVFVGIVIGFVSSLLFSVVQFAGALIDTLMGFGFVELVDPFTETSTTTLGQLKTLIFTIVFIVLGGHFYMILAIQKSFEVIPLLGVQVPGGSLMTLLTNVTTGVFISALKLAAPAFVTLVITSLALGVVARTVPQMNVYFVGLPLTIALGFGTTIIAFPVLAMMFQKMFNAMLNDVWSVMLLMG